MPGRYTVSTEGDITILRDAERRAEAHVDARRGNNVVRYRVAAPGGGEPLDVLIPPEGDQGLGANGYAAGNPILFPFPNRVKGGRYTFGGKDLQLDVNETARGNHIHGLVSSRPWHVDTTGSDKESTWQIASLQLDADPEIMRQYPFPCTISVATRLRDGVLIQETEVRNTGAEPLPMGYGTHPWFPATLRGAPREATEVKVPGSRHWKLANLVPTGETVDVTTDSAKYDLRQWHALDGNEYDDVFTALVHRPDGWSESGIRYPAAGLQIIMEAGPEFREWVIFAPKSRPVVCLEAYTGTTNAVNLQAEGVDAGLVVVQPGERWSGTLRISLRSDA